MSFAEKLKNYFIDNGVQIKWFAKKLGVTGPYLYHIMDGNKKLPPKYWNRVIHLTHGQITLADFLEASLKDVEDLKVEGKKEHTPYAVSLSCVNK